MDNCLLDRVATVNSRLVSEIHTQIQTVATHHVFERLTFLIECGTNYIVCFDAIRSVYVYVCTENFDFVSHFQMIDVCISTSRMFTFSWANLK